jgi:hypothetical protein
MAATLYVWQESPSPAPPYATWTTAATNIQDAVDAASAGDEIVVTNGVYATGGRAVHGTMTNRVAVDKAVTLRSVNGPEVTQIRGYKVPGTIVGATAIRCVYLTNGAMLGGFTLTNGSTAIGNNGGGVYCESPSAVVSNCVLSGNSSGLAGGGAFGGQLQCCRLKDNTAIWGGGAWSAVLHNCVAINNQAGEVGGGAGASSLHHCTFTENSAGEFGGGVWDCAVYGSIIFGNDLGGDYYPYSYGSFDSSCTQPLPNRGSGNITNAPLLVDLANGDLRLQSNSPCINAGHNAYVSGNTDLDGNPRIVGGTVDMGAYEFQSPGSVISYAWLRQFGLPTDGSADFADPDADPLNTWQEWQADTNPTNALSVLRIESISPGPPLAVLFSSSLNHLYTLRYATNVTGAPWTDVPGQTGVRGTGGAQTLRDTNAAPPRFYRVGVRLP